MKRKGLVFLFTMFILIVLASIFILHNLTSPEPPGYLELLDVKEERVGKYHIYCNVFHVKWHGRKTELEFTLYKRTKVAGHAVPGYVTARWNQTNGNVIGIRDGDVCAAKDGDVFTLSIPIFASYIRISYDNKTIHFSGTTGEMQEIPR